MSTSKILLCATDAGGARNLSPLLKGIKASKYQPVLITSPEMLGLFDAGGAETIDANNITPESADGFLINLRPAVIICGTSRYASPERLLVAAGRKSGIGTVVVLDEWFNYRMRFEDERKQLVYLPDAIAAMDELAKEEAVKEGLPEARIHITGSPSLAALTDRAEQFATNPPDMPQFLQSTGISPVITFLSETHAADYGSKPGEYGPMGSYLGYTENTVRDDILGALKNLNQPCTFVEKLHPSTQEEDADTLFTERIRWLRVRKADLWSLLWHSRAIIGMRSMALLEALILGRPAVSYQPGLLGIDYCSAVRLGLLERLSTPAELEQWCRAQLAASEIRPEGTIRRFPFARKDAPEKVIDLAIATASLPKAGCR